LCIKWVPVSQAGLVSSMAGRQAGLVSSMAGRQAGLVSSMAGRQALTILYVHFISIANQALSSLGSQSSQQLPVSLKQAD
jgi:hypothetical protein